MAEHTYNCPYCGAGHTVNDAEPPEVPTTAHKQALRPKRWRDMRGRNDLIVRLRQLGWTRAQVAVQCNLSLRTVDQLWER